MPINLFFKSMLLITTLFLSGCYFKNRKSQTNQSTETVKVESQPIESQPIESQPIESQPVEPKLIEPKPIEPKPIEPKPIEVEPLAPQLAFKLMGKISLDQSKLIEKNADVKNTIVYFEPSAFKITELPTTNEVISTQNKQFEPNVLAITAGSQVSFPNMDRILHNVFSVSPNSDFDLGLYSAGTTKSVTFSEPGVIYVHCNVHHTMQADILVLDTPYFTQVDNDGNFELEGLPELEGTLKTWHPRGNIESLAINSEFNQQLIKQSVVITRPEIPEHSNKFGKSYRRKRY